MSSGTGSSRAKVRTGGVAVVAARCVAVAGAALASVVLSLMWQAAPAVAAAPDWVHHVGTTNTDAGFGVAVDGSGNTYVTGFTWSTFAGSPEPNAGNSDVFVASYTPDGTRRWVHQLGAADNDIGRGVAVDNSGNVYVTGQTSGTLPGSPEAYAGWFDVFVASYTSDGSLRWVHQLGAADSDIGHGVAVDNSGNVYVTGQTSGTLPGSSDPNAGSGDMFVASYDSGGAIRWVHQLGTTGGESGNGLGVDGSGNVYITGQTQGTLPGSFEPNAGGPVDVFVASYDSGGAVRWVHQLGSTSGEMGYGLGVDGGGNVYITGYTQGTLPGSSEPHGGGDEVFVASYTSGGASRWVHQLSADSYIAGYAIGVDATGNVYVTGPTDFYDVFLAAYSSSGARRWVYQLGSATYDYGHGVAVDGSGYVYVTGRTQGTLPGSSEPNAGTQDAFLARWSDGDGPSSITVTKDANPTSISAPGGDVTFSVAVSNDSANDWVTIDTLDDDIYGDLAGRGDCAVPQALAPGTAYTCSFSGTVTGNAGDTHTNTITASGIDHDGASVADSDDATVSVTAPPDGSISVGVATVPAGGAATVTFSGAVTATVGDGGRTDPSVVSPGNYTVDAAAPAGWAISGVVCDDADSSSAGGTITFVVDPDEDVFCVVAVAEAAAADTVSVAFTGGRTYSNSGPLAFGDLDVACNANTTVRTVTGAGTLAGVNGGQASVAFSIRQFFFLPVYLGNIVVNDPGAALNLNTPVLFANITKPPGTSAGGHHNWVDLTRIPWKPYTLTWTITDNT